MIQMNTDRIEKSFVLRAPRSRVWEALTNVEELNSWFGVSLQGEMAPAARLRGNFTIPGHEHQVMDITIETLEPEQRMSWRWVPGNGDPEDEGTTLVTFDLEDADGGTRLTMVESGFDNLPPEKYEEAYRGNSGGWDWQMDNVRRYLGEID
jgi:uncharacterized protein YndB with AHSA1/START domain